MVRGRGRHLFEVFQKGRFRFSTRVFLLRVGVVFYKVQVGVVAHKAV